MYYLCCGGIDSTLACPKQGANETSMPFDPPDPSYLIGFIARTVPNHKGVSRTCKLKVEIPSEVLLPRITINIYAPAV